MNAGKKTTVTAGSDKKSADKKNNPFSKLIEDKKRIANAVTNGEPLSDLKGIKFVRPL